MVYSNFSKCHLQLSRIDKGLYNENAKLLQDNLAHARRLEISETNKSSNIDDTSQRYLEAVTIIDNLQQILNNIKLTILDKSKASQNISLDELLKYLQHSNQLVNAIKSFTKN